MHYHAEVWIPHLLAEQPENAIDRIMAPYEEGHDADGTMEVAGFWDWYQIGGRYTGAHNPGAYDPEKDPRNVETCFLCKGTGFRTDEIGEAVRKDEPTYTCNGCGTHNVDGTWGHGPHGPGRTTKWPTQWAPYDGDVIPVSAVRDDLTAYTLIVEDKVLMTDTWDGKTFVPGPLKGRKVKEVLDELGVTDGYLVTVDYHS